MESEITTITEEGNLFLNKSSENIRIRVEGGKLGLSQRKLINTFHYFAKDNMLERETHAVPLTKILEMANYKSNDREFIKNQSRELASRIVEWDYLNEADQRKQWGVSAFLSEIVFHSNGMVMYSYPPTIRKLMASRGNKGDVSMMIQRLFNSAYAHALWENCLLFVKEGETEKYSVDDLKVLLGINDDECTSYKEFKIFNRAIIQLAVQEVNELSDLIVSLVTHRKSKVVTHVSFTVDRKNQSSLQFDDDNRQRSLQDRIVGFGCTESDTLRILEEYEPSYIEGNLNYVEEKVLTGKVTSNPVAYFLKAIKIDYRPKQPEILKLANEAKEAKKKLESSLIEASNITKKIVTDDADKIRKSVKAKYDALNELDKTDLLESYADSISSNTIFFNAYKKSGLRSKIAKTSFLQYLADQWK